MHLEIIYNLNVLHQNNFADCFKPFDWSREILINLYLKKHFYFESNITSQSLFSDLLQQNSPQWTPTKRG